MERQPQENVDKILQIINQSKKADNKREIVEGDFGYFDNKSRPRIFHKNDFKDFVEAYCLCSSRCYSGDGAFGHDVNGEQRDRYFVVGNLERPNEPL